MALKTTLEQLESVQATIALIEEGAQTYELEEGQMVERADLKTLYERESRLLGKYKREQNQSSGGTQNRVRFVNPS